MKRYTMVGAAVSLALFSGAALAAPNVVNTTQKGSLLIFPEIEVSNGFGVQRNTIIRITNDNTKPITVKCYYGEFTDDVYDKPTRDFQFDLTKNQPAYWEARDGTGTITAPDFPRGGGGQQDAGQLICWAVSKGGGTQVKWNHLSGTATVMLRRGSVLRSYSYNAYSFYARGAKNKRQVGSTPGHLDLDGTAAGGGYDKCGKYVLGHFTPTNTQLQVNNIGLVEQRHNFLALSSCDQDLSPVGKANPVPLGCADGSCGQDIVFDVWNEDEVKFTGAREKADSWWRVYLGTAPAPLYSDIDVAPENLTVDTLQTESAYFRAQSDDNIGLVGVLVSFINVSGGPAPSSYNAVTLNHAGTRAGVIKWRTQDDDPPEKR